jgi:hypothetical protein
MTETGIKRHRRWLWLLLIPAAVGFFLFSQRDQGFSIANCNRVFVGMKRDQVEHILGRKPVALDSDPTKMADAWFNEKGSVLVTYDTSGRVTSVVANGGARDGGSPGVFQAWMDRIASWFY